MTSISAVLPAFNEEANLTRTVTAVVQTIEKLADDYEVVVVDDGSRDGTAQVATDLSKQYPHVRLVKHEKNQGYGQALATGFAAAQNELIFFTDSDAQFDVSELARLLPLMDGADMVIGYRAPRRDPIVRKAYAFGWRILNNALFGYTARDIDCAFKLFRRSVIEAIKIESRGAMFSAELLVRARAKGFRIREAPVTHLPRLAGNPTGAKPSVILRAFKELLLFRVRFTIERLKGERLKGERLKGESFESVEPTTTKG